MKNTIQHEEFVNLYNKDINIFKLLFNETTSLKELNKRIIKLSNRYAEFSYKEADKMKGDIFEIFSECFFKILSADNRIGVYNYTPEKSGNDYGVDAVGIGINKLPLTIQCKFRSNIATELTQDDIKQFPLQSIVNYDVDKDTRTNIILFTNAKGLHWATDSKVFSYRVRTIGNNEISNLVDNNHVFWMNLCDIIENTIKEKYK